MVGLVAFRMDAKPVGGFFDQGQQVGVGAAAVDTGFPDAEHIEIRSVQYQNIHLYSSKMRWAANSGAP